MNLLDEAIGVVSPSWALKRDTSRIKRNLIKNSGYDQGGASKKKNSFKGFNASSKTPYDDIDKNLNTLRQRSRSLYMTSPIATSAVKNVRTNVVGQGLRLKARIDFKYLGLTQDEADEWERNTERKFNLWAESKFCDSKGLDNFYELQQIALIGWVLNGDSFALIKRSKSTWYMPYSLKIQLIESDRISTPNSNGSSNLIKKLHNGNQIISGVEIDKEGCVVAYHICSTYPTSSEKKEWVRIEAVGKKTGIYNVIHIMEGERSEQYRGVPFLAPVIESLKQITRYTEAELMAAVINGMFSVFIEVEKGDEKEAFKGFDEEDATDRDIKLGNGMVNILNPGEKIGTVDPNRPNINFDTFVTGMCKQIGGALEIPYELLFKTFNSSYSASRASLMEAWKAFRMRRTWFANDFCQPIYEAWLSEAVANGTVKAPGFFNSPFVRKAWCGVEWNGPAPGQIDPTKEVKAARERVELGVSTREQETMQLTGGDFDKNVEQLVLEREKMQIINKENN